MTYIKSIPTHVWLVLVFMVLLTAYYIRPDPVTVNMLQADFAALLLSLRTGSDQRPPP